MYLGLLLTIINSGVKLLTASLVLDVITGWGLPGCALFVVLVSVLWGALAGIKTVIWTDFLLFLMFSAGALFALVFIAFNVQMSLPDALAELDAQAKLVLFDFSTDPAKRYTIWAGVIGGIALNIAQGSTQGTWQRVRACRSVADAKKAYSYAALFYVMHLVILAVGLALAVFYIEQPLPDSVTVALGDAPDRIFPYFILTEIPVGLSGLFIAAIFAAAISTLDSALAESADLSVSHIYAKFLNPGASEAHYVRVSRVMMAFWGCVFFGVALFFGRYSAEGLLDLTFKLPNYVYGAIFGSIVLARFGIGRLPTVLLGFAVATALVVWMSHSGIAFFYWCPIAGTVMVLTVWALERSAPETTGVVSS
jgi:Na+/proline symporter